MNQYPLDEEGIVKIFNQFMEHQRAQTEIIVKLREYLREAMTYVQDEDGWYEDAEDLIYSLDQRKMAFDNFRFDQKNGHKTEAISPYEGKAVPIIPGQAIDPQLEQDLNKLESGFGEIMTEEELARHFGEPLPKKPKKGKGFKDMTLEEIESWEAAQDNSNDIYKVSARLKNLARSAVEGNLTAQGTMVVNTFAHMIKAFYDFAERLPDKEIKIKLIELTRQQEVMPANLISALWAGVKEEK